jgi:hypothetical protein
MASKEMPATPIRDRIDPSLDVGLVRVHLDRHPAGAGECGSQSDVAMIL